MNQQKQQVLRLLNEVLELPDETLQGSESLEELDWNSLSVIGFIALCDERFNVVVAPGEIAKAKTIDDLVNLVKPAAATTAV